MGTQYMKLRADVSGYIKLENVIANQQCCYATQVLYGQKCLLQDDFSSREVQAMHSVLIGKAIKYRQDQLSVYNAVQPKIEQYAGQLVNHKCLRGLQHWQKQAETAVLHRHKAP